MLYNEDDRAARIAIPLLAAAGLGAIAGAAAGTGEGCVRAAFSAAGAGVSWLHVRLDDRPKYYGFLPYKQMW